MSEELIAYAVEYIEVEFGQRPEGYKLYLFENECIAKTKEASTKGSYSGGYLGPSRPLCYVEVPFASLEEALQIKLRLEHIASTNDYWKPKFRGKTVSIR